MIISPNGVRETPDELRPAAKELSDSTSSSGVLWCGRGATALYWGCRLAMELSGNGRRNEIILPATTCISVVYACLLAGLRARFADTNPLNGMLDVQGVRACAREQTLAVLATHLFGQTLDLGALEEWCRCRGVILIEDCAHSLGGCLPNGQPVGSTGDMAIYSFGPTKVIECGGGALVVKARQSVEALTSLMGSASSFSEAAEQSEFILTQSARYLEHALIELCRVGRHELVSGIAERMVDAYAPIYLRPLEDVTALAHAWTTIPRVAAERCKKAEIYARELQGGAWSLLNGHRKSGISWRYSFVVHFPEQRALLMESIRRDGALASNLYWPLNEVFGTGDNCPNARVFGNSVVNLCVDGSVTESWIKARARGVRWQAEAIRRAGGL